MGWATPHLQKSNLIIVKYSDIIIHYSVVACYSGPGIGICALLKFQSFENQRWLLVPRAPNSFDRQAVAYIHLQYR